MQRPVIYFARVRIGRRSLIKIGTTHRLEERMRRHYHWFDSVRLLAVLPGWRQRERELLKQFDHLRALSLGRAHPELFRPDKALLDWIDKNASPPPPGRYVPRPYDMTKRNRLWREAAERFCMGARTT